LHFFVDQIKHRASQLGFAKMPEFFMLAPTAAISGFFLVNFIICRVQNGRNLGLG
jgi:hypothetical protein